MDYDPCFVDCCKNCNSVSQKFRSPTSGQGDCKCSGEIQDQNYWVGADKGMKLRSKIIREKDKIGVKEEKQKSLMDVGCNCFSKCCKKQECKSKHEAKQEKNEPEIFENCSSGWSNLVSNGWKSQMERLYVSEERKCSDHSTEKLLTENVLELEEKVDFLLRIFKDNGYKLTNDNYSDSLQTKPGGSLVDAWHLFNLNKRLCAAEQGIEKLALVLEELLKEFSKKKGPSLLDEGLSYNEPLDFEGMSMGQRINFLKNRNDLLLSLIKTYLKSSSVEDVCSRMAALSNEYDPKPSVLSPRLHLGGKNQKDITREEIMETLKNLQVSDTQLQKKVQKYNEQPNNRIIKREQGLKYPANKLEVISEQAELALSQSDESENLMEEFQRKNGVRNLKGKFSQINEDGDGKGLGLCDVTSRLLAQEAMLKSSLDKVHSELFSKLDSSEKNYMKSNFNFLSSIQMPTKEGSNCDFDLGFDTSSDVSCLCCETDITENSLTSDLPSINSKFMRHEEYKEPIKEERSTGSGPCKDFVGKKSDEQMIHKIKSNPKILHKNGCAVIGSPQKTVRNSCCLVDICSSSREGARLDAQARKQRPLTAPVPRTKTLPASSPKPSAPEKKKSSGINANVRNKNKILLSKKSFVQTS